MVTVEEVKLEIIPLQQRGSPDSGNHAADANREESSGDGYSCQKYGQRGSPDSVNKIATAKSEENISVNSNKPSGDGFILKKHGQRESPNSSNHPGNDKREENFPVVPEKPSEDGYNWRKYGQKNIKGNKHIRSYYRCSYQKCLVKKQIERAPDGRITDTSYFGLHEHPKPQTGLGVELPSNISMKVQTGDKHSSLIAKEKLSTLHAITPAGADIMETDELSVTPIICKGTHDLASPSSVTKDYRTSDDFVVSKRRKVGDDYDTSMENKSKSRWVVETVSAVDIINDGYRWRKYGQKLVKDNPNARSYYRCTNAGCPAKKRVERASHDPTLVITTYEGHHDHDVPHGRTSLPHTSPPSANIASSLNIVKTEEVIRAQSTAAVADELGNNSDHAPKEINQSIAVYHKQEQGSTDQAAEKDNPPEEVNHAQSSQGIDMSNTINHQPAKSNAEVVASHAQSSAGIIKGSTIDHPDEKGSAAEVKKAESSSPISKQEEDKTMEFQPKDSEPLEEVNQAESNSPICKQDEGKTIDLPTKKDDLPVEVNRAASCDQERNSIDHKSLEEVDQPHSIATSTIQEGKPTDHPAE